MNVDFLKSIFVSAGIPLVHVRAPGDDFPADTSNPIVTGTLDDYVAAVKALRAPVVLLYTMVLQPEVFLYLPDEDEEDGEEPAIVDLSVGNPDMELLKRHVGDVGVFRLSASAYDLTLDYLIQEEWHRDLVERRTAATDVLDDDHNSRLERERLNEEARLGEILASLDRLIDDEKFIRLPTQKAMLAYAKESIPELAEVDAADLKARIQELNAKIAAKYG